VEKGWRGILTALAVYRGVEPDIPHRETAKAATGTALRLATLLKQGVNERSDGVETTGIPPKTAKNSAT
jgi:hypothetical protein